MTPEALHALGVIVRTISSIVVFIVILKIIRLPP